MPQPRRRGGHAPRCRSPGAALLGIVSRRHRGADSAAHSTRAVLSPACRRASSASRDAWSLSPSRLAAAAGETARTHARADRRHVQVQDSEIGLAGRGARAGSSPTGCGVPRRPARSSWSTRAAARSWSRESLGAISCPFGPPHAATPLGFVLLAAVGGSAQVVIADASGVVRKARLDDIFLGEARVDLREGRPGRRPRAAGGLRRAPPERRSRRSTCGRCASGATAARASPAAAAAGAARSAVPSGSTGASRSRASICSRPGDRSGRASGPRKRCSSIRAAGPRG